MADKKVGIISTILHSPAELKPLTDEIIPGVQVVNIVDDSLVREVLDNGYVTAGICRRLTAYAKEMQYMGCRAVVANCSSMSGMLPYIQKQLDIPIMSIDRAMAVEAVSLGKKIAIVATAFTTKGPTTDMIIAAAKEAEKDVDIEFFMAEGAYDAMLKENDREKHDRILIQTIENARRKADVVCLAQGSMFRIAEQYRNASGIPVIHTFRSGIAQFIPYLD